MITLEQWEEYMRHIDLVNEEIDKKNREEFKRYHDSEFVETRFLFWKWTAFYPHCFPPRLRRNVEPTIEGCMDYFLRQKNERKTRKNTPKGDSSKKSGMA